MLTSKICTEHAITCIASLGSGIVKAAILDAVRALGMSRGVSDGQEIEFYHEG